MRRRWENAREEDGREYHENGPGCCFVMFCRTLRQIESARPTRFVICTSPFCRTCVRMSHCCKRLATFLTRSQSPLAGSDVGGPTRKRSADRPNQGCRRIMRERQSKVIVPDAVGTCGYISLYIYIHITFHELYLA